MTLEEYKKSIQNLNIPEKMNGNAFYYLEKDIEKWYATLSDEDLNILQNENNNFLQKTDKISLFQYYLLKFEMKPPKEFSIFEEFSFYKERRDLLLSKLRKEDLEVVLKEIRHWQDKMRY